MNEKYRSHCSAFAEELRALDFAVTETAMYLDAYPDNREALDYYHTLAGKRGQVAAQYERTCGPLTIYGNENASSWDWIKSPWPWEFAANHC